MTQFFLGLDELANVFTGGYEVGDVAVFILDGANGLLLVK
jgi:hypothetical protein